MIDLIDQLLPILVILAQLATLVLLVGFIFSLISKRSNEVVDFFSRHGVLLSLIVALASMLGSLFYSEIMGYDPCKLCWYQRILMYPQVILLFIALVKKYSREILDYSLWLSLLGGIIAAYHYLGQISVVSDLPCGVVGYSESCSQRFVMEYGYITIPIMALTGFAFIFLTMLVKKFVKQD